MSGWTSYSPPPITPTGDAEGRAQHVVPLAHEIERRRQHQRAAPPVVDGEAGDPGLAGARRQHDHAAVLARLPGRERLGLVGARLAADARAARPARRSRARDRRRRGRPWRAPGAAPRRPTRARGSRRCARPTGSRAAPARRARARRARSSPPERRAGARRPPCSRGRSAFSTEPERKARDRRVRGALEAQRPRVDDQVVVDRVGEVGAVVLLVEGDPLRRRCAGWWPSPCPR